ncbi:hypothetical protein EON63_05810 [archaeon]|nr:MAG: hypothetical protein EON63_05810 [archaeon]
MAQDPLVRVSIGIELEDIRYQLSMQNLSCVLKDKHTVSPAYGGEVGVADVEGGVKVPSTPPKKGRGKGKGESGVKDNGKGVDGEEEQKGGEKASGGGVEVAEVTPLSSKQVEVHCPVNFICSDIDVATTMVSIGMISYMCM